MGIYIVRTTILAKYCLMDMISYGDAANGRGPFSKETISLSDFESDGNAVATVRRAMKCLGELALRTHGCPPLLDRWCIGRAAPACVSFSAVRQEVDAELSALAGRRNRRKVREASRWAAFAAARTAHQVTRPRETVTMFSASAGKHHRGEASPQQAVDKGGAEWSVPWRAEKADSSQ